MAALLKYREHQRDLCRQLLAEAIAEDQALFDQRGRFEAQRAQQLEEMRQLTAEPVVDIDRSAARRFHASQLSVEILLVENSRVQVAKKIAERRHHLVLADQKVKALEKLSEKHHEEYAAEQERRTARELEETWMAAHLLESSES